MGSHFGPFYRGRVPPWVPLATPTAFLGGRRLLVVGVGGGEGGVGGPTWGYFIAGVVDGVTPAMGQSSAIKWVAGPI